MKRKIVGLFVLLFCSNVFYAQSLCVTADSKGRMGYMNEQGTIVIPCQYQEAHAFKEGVAKVKKGLKYGFIDTKGNVVLPFKYDQIAPFDQGLAKVTIGKKVGLISEKGESVLPVEYSAISSFNCYGKAWINKGGRIEKNGTVIKGLFGIFSSKEGMLVSPVYKRLGEFVSDDNRNVWTYKTDQAFETESGLRMRNIFFKDGDTLRTDCKYLWYSIGNLYTIVYAGLLSERGEILIPVNTYNVIWYPQSGMVRFWHNVGKARKNVIKIQQGYWDLAEKKEIVVQEAEGDASKPAEEYIFPNGIHLQEFIGGVAFIGANTGKDGYFINRVGEKVTEDLKYAGPCCEGKIVVLNTQGKAAVIDTLGKQIIPYGAYDDLHTGFSENMIGVKKDGLWGFIDVNQNLQVPYAYEKSTTVSHGWFAAMKNGKFGMLHISGGQLVPFEYEDVSLVNELKPSNVWVKKDTLWYNYDTDQQKILNARGYAWVTDFGKGLAGVRTPELLADTTQRNSIYIVDKKDQLLFPLPLPNLYYEEACSYIRAKGGHPLSQAEAQRFVLYRTRDSRTYQLNTIVPDSDWDF